MPSEERWDHAGSRTTLARGDVLRCLVGRERRRHDATHHRYARVCAATPE